MHCDDFAVYTNIKSLCGIPGTNTMLYVNYTSIEKKRCQDSLKRKRRRRLGGSVTRVVQGQDEAWMERNLPDVQLT